MGLYLANCHFKSFAGGLDEVADQPGSRGYCLICSPRPGRVTPAIQANAALGVDGAIAATGTRAVLPDSRQGFNHSKPQAVE